MIYTDQHQFILHHKVMLNQTDKELALLEGRQVVLNYQGGAYDFASLSYDRGFLVGLPKKV